MPVCSSLFVAMFIEPTAIVFLIFLFILLLLLKTHRGLKTELEAFRVFSLDRKSEVDAMLAK